MDRETVEKVLGKIDFPKTLSILRSLVKIPSYLGQEGEKADYVSMQMERLGLEVYEMPLTTGDPWRRRNVIGTLRGKGGGRDLMVCAHLDTHWPKEDQLYPHEGVVKDGKIYGVGTGDSHGNLAAFFGAIDAIMRSDVELRGDLIFAATVDELGHKLGAKMIADSGIKADMCIEGDVGHLDEVCIVHTGKVEVEIVTRGQSQFVIGAHAERTGMRLVNAVAVMNAVINNLQRMVREEQYFHVRHPLLPGEGAGFELGPIIGGSVGYGLPTNPAGHTPGAYGLARPPPTWCRLRVGCRYWPGQTAEEFVNLVRKWAERAKEEHPGAIIEVNPYLDDGNTPFEISPEAEVVKLLKRAAKYVIGKEIRNGSCVCSGELPFYQRAGMECAMYGPNYRVGSSDEHITIEELMNLTKVYAVAILEACS
jgi:acetylornithine deacetylase